MLRSARLELKRVELTDAAFFLVLLNDPSWLANIGDRGVRSLADAESYIRGRIWGDYERYGYGIYVVRPGGAPDPIGICGLVKRPFLTAPDLGVALLPAWAGQGHASEAGRAVIEDAERAHGITHLYAITKPSNQRSISMLGRLGFRHEGPLAVPPDGVEVQLYVRP